MRASTRRRRRAPGERRRRSSRGTALVLVPAMTLVLLCLGAIAVDAALVHATHRQVHRAASAAAQDAAAMIDEDELLTTGDLVIDADRATRLVHAHFAAAKVPGELVDLRVATGPDEVDLTVVVAVEHVLLPALPGQDRASELTVRARGRLHR